MIFILKVSLQKTPSRIPTKLDLYWKCFFKRHFSQFHKIQYILKVSLDSTISQNLIYIDFIVKVSLERHLQSPKNWIYTKSIIKKKMGWYCSTISIYSWKFRNNSQENWFILKVSLEETLSIIFKKMGLYWSTISIHNENFRIYAEGVSSRDTFHKRKKKSIS